MLLEIILIAVTVAVAAVVLIAAALDRRDRTRSTRPASNRRV